MFNLQLILESSYGLSFLFELSLDMNYEGHSMERVVKSLPDELPVLGLSRTEIIQVYYLLEVDWNKGGWIRERPSNVRRGLARGYSGESTDVQIHRMFGSSEAYKVFWNEYLRDLTWDSISLCQKILYYYKVKEWGLTEVSYD